MKTPPILLDKKLPSDVHTRAAEAFATHERVVIHENNEAGPWQWSVLIEEEELWLDSFPTLQEAERFCETYDLPVTDIWPRKR